MLWSGHFSRGLPFNGGNSSARQERPQRAKDAPCGTRRFTCRPVRRNYEARHSTLPLQLMKNICSSALRVPSSRPFWRLRRHASLFHPQADLPIAPQVPGSKLAGEKHGYIFQAAATVITQPHLTMTLIRDHFKSRQATAISWLMPNRTSLTSFMLEPALGS